MFGMDSSIFFKVLSLSLQELFPPFPLFPGPPWLVNCTVWLMPRSWLLIFECILTFDVLHCLILSSITRDFLSDRFVFPSRSFNSVWKSREQNGLQHLLLCHYNEVSITPFVSVSGRFLGCLWQQMLANEQILQAWVWAGNMNCLPKSYPIAVNGSLSGA